MTYVPRRKVTALIPNKYEAIRVVALEARRLNSRARALDCELPGKITTLAIERFIDGKVSHFDERERAAEIRREREEEQAQEDA